jgi:hypothetical protein
MLSKMPFVYEDKLSLRNAIVSFKLKCKGH